MNDNIENVEVNEAEIAEFDVFEFEVDDVVEGLMHRC
ncbi:Uncharacterised protein [Legionella taurinensis]|nr:Uncharacterised protein [Legionella taurinensis]